MDVLAGCNPAVATGVSLLCQGETHAGDVVAASTSPGGRDCRIDAPGRAATTLMS